MSLVSVGSLSLAVAVPGAAGAAVAGAAGINAALPDIEARIAALASFAPSPGDFSADISLANNIIADANLAISVGLTPPSLSAQIAIIAALVADLEAAVVSINANLTIVTDLISLLAAAGVDAYAWDGANDAFGPALTTALGAGTAHCSGLVLKTTSGATWTAMSTLFKVVP